MSYKSWQINHPKLGHPAGYLSTSPSVISILNHSSDQSSHHMAWLFKGDEFKDLVRRYLHNGFTKGIPSLFVDIKTLYSDTTKQQIIEEVVSEFRETLDPSTEKSDPVLAEQPTTYLWTLYFLAQHYSHLSNFKLALSTLDTALAHTPTLLELYSCKARVLKRAGDLVGAAQSIEEARKLDGQDRFVNTKSGKYHLRAGLIDEASEIFGLFTKVRQYSIQFLFSEWTWLEAYPNPARKMPPVLALTLKTCSLCCS